MKRGLALFVFAVVACPSLPRACRASPAGPDGDADRPEIARAPQAGTALGLVWRAERACGLNSLYFLLRSLGKSPDYDTLQGQLIKDDLASLQDLKRAARRYGVDLRVVKMTPDELREVPKPVLAHFEIANTRGETGGHFVVVVAADRDHVQYVDGTTAEMLHLGWNDFNKVWSGHAAYPRGEASPYYMGIGAFAAVGAGAGLVVKAFRSRISKSRPAIPTT